MTFPDVLNLNPFINEAPVRDEPDGNRPIDDEENLVDQQQWRRVVRTDSDDEGICLDTSSALNGNSNTTRFVSSRLVEFRLQCLFIFSPAESDVNEIDANLINETMDQNLIDSYFAEVSVHSSRLVSFGMGSIFQF